MSGKIKLKGKLWLTFQTRITQIGTSYMRMLSKDFRSHLKKMALGLVSLRMAMLLVAREQNLEMDDLIGF